ncbi:MAG: 4Fe-4S dicluster domain-containing protein [Chloroflexota bacterium]
MINYLPIALALILSCALLYFAFISHRENERRATRVAVLLSIVVPVSIALMMLLPSTIQVISFAFIFGLGVVAILLVLFARGFGETVLPVPMGRIDERDTMFARQRLVPGSENYEEYYSRHPKLKEVDDQIRRAPGLLSPLAKEYHPYAAALTGAAFDTIDALHALVEPSPSALQVGIDPQAASQYVIGIAKHLGALQAGVTRLRDYHVYSHAGRRVGNYGVRIQLDHHYAIAISVEMSHDNVQLAPQMMQTAEVAKQYLNSATIAVQIAKAIASLGYRARAHIDGNYQVVCPLVAQDAGLGVIGRMGILMSEKAGPRVRLAVVTTDLPLLENSASPDVSMWEFCRICRKCADNCPTRSISSDEPIDIGGVQRWQIRSETCYHYWNTIGTDCGRCLAVCPYSHPNTFAHNFVRWTTKRSALAQRALLFMDDLFYGREPEPRKLPSWLPHP